MTHLLVLPVLVPLAAGLVSLLWWGRRRLHRRLAVVAHAAHLGVSLALLLEVRSGGVQALHLGGWRAPFGITFVADLFGGIMVVLAALLGLVVVVYSLGGIGRRQEALGYYPLIHLLMAGVSGAFLTGDLFNLFVWFEVLLVASFVLLTLGGARDRLEGGVKYAVLNLFASALFLAGVGLLYGMTGTLNLADLAVRLRGAADPGAVTPVAVLLLTAFGIKAAVFPLFFWLPASYHTPPVALAALFGGLLAKVGIYAIVRVFTLLFVHDPGFTHPLLLVVAGLTMVTGVLGAVAQTEMRRLLSFHIVSQMGYLLMGVGLLTVGSLLGTVFFMIHIVLAKAALFLAAGLAHHLGGSYRIDRLGGLYGSHPGVSLLFAVPALSLAGFPPLSGFFGKLALVKAGVDEQAYWIVAVALGVSLLTLYSMAKIWTRAYWAPGAGGSGSLAPSASRFMVPAVGLLAALMLGIGLSAGPVLEISRGAAAQLLDPAEYVAAVLGEVP